MNNIGIQGYLSKAHHRRGWQLHVTRYGSDGKMYRPEIEVTWIECQEHSYREPVYLDGLEQFDMVDQQSKQYGENVAMKSEIEFLRAQIHMLLAQKVSL